MNRRCSTMLPMLVITIFVLLGPVALADAGDYVAATGDTLSSIAQKLLGNGEAYSEIVALTKAREATDPSYASLADPDLIEVGWKLALPIRTPRHALAETTPRSRPTRPL